MSYTDTETNTYSAAEGAAAAINTPLIQSSRGPSERVPFDSFPHPPRPGSTNLPTTLENVEHLLAQGRFKPRFNVIKKRLELRYDDGSPASMSEVVSFAILHGFGTGWMYQFVDQIGAERPFNPVKEWILSKAWDGRDRVSELLETVVVRDDYPKHLKEPLLRRWLLSATAAALAERRFRARGVLTLQGDQGIGKTTWISKLLPAGDLQYDYIKLDHHLDGGNKDSIIGAITHWITEIGELDSSFKKDIARLKGFLTNDCDKLRRPYAREESEYARRTVFAATVNEETFLIDPTGNSRWWTIAVDRMNYDHDIDTQQMFAQLAVDYEAGEQWWLTSDEEHALAAYNLRHRSVSAIAERIRECIDFEKLSQGAGRARTAIEVLKEIGIANPTNPQCKECGSALRELLGPPRRINGNMKWRVPIRAFDLPPLSTPEEGDDEIY